MGGLDWGMIRVLFDGLVDGLSDGLSDRLYGRNVGGLLKQQRGSNN